MTYDIQALFQTHTCRVVLAADSKVAITIRDAIIQAHPSYHYKSDPIFSHRKFGPFLIKNKKTIWQILANTPKIKQEGHTFLQQQLNTADLQIYADRRPHTLSTFLKFFASVLYTSFNGGSAFLLCGCPEETGRRIVQWLENYIPNNYDVIWISSHSPKEVNELMDKETRSGSHYSFFTVEGEKVIPLDKTLLEAPKDATSEITASTPRPKHPGAGTAKLVMTAEDLYQEGRKYDHFSGQGVSGKFSNSPPEEDAKEAFYWYMRAAEAGSLKGQTALAFMYYCGFGCETNREQSLVWYVRAAFNDAYDKNTADADTTSAYNAARQSLKTLMFEFSNGREVIRKLVGSKAEEFIKEAEVQKELEDNWEDVPKIDPNEVFDFLGI